MTTTERTRQPIDFTNIRDLATVIFKHKYKVLAVFLIIFAGTAICALKLPRPFEANSVLLVKYGREFQQRPEESKSGSAPSVPPQAIISGEMRIISSRDVLTKVVDNVRPENLYPELVNTPDEGPRRTHAAVAKIERNLRVVNLPGSNLIELTFAHNDPAMAAKTLNLIVDCFKEKHVEVFSGGGTSFLENQMKATQDRLDTAGKKFAEFRHKYGVFSFEEQKSNLIAQRNTVEAGARATQTQIGELQQRALWIRNPKWTPSNILEIRAPLTTLEQRERELLAKFSSGSRAVQNLHNEIEDTKVAVQKNIELLRQAELQKIEGDLSVAKARISDLTRQSRQLDAEVQNLDAHGRAVQDLRRELAEQEHSYQTYTRKAAESSILDDMDRRKMLAISVVENASALSTRRKQRLSTELLVTAGFAGGIFGGVALVLLIEMLSSGMTFRHSAERRLGLRVLVAIPDKNMAGPRAVLGPDPA